MPCSIDENVPSVILTNLPLLFPLVSCSRMQSPLRNPIAAAQHAQASAPSIISSSVLLRSVEDRLARRKSRLANRAKAADLVGTTRPSMQIKINGSTLHSYLIIIQCSLSVDTSLLSSAPFDAECI